MAPLSEPTLVIPDDLTLSDDPLSSSLFPRVPEGGKGEKVVGVGVQVATSTLNSFAQNKTYQESLLPPKPKIPGCAVPVHGLFYQFCLIKEETEEEKKAREKKEKDKKDKKEKEKKDKKEKDRKGKDKRELAPEARSLDSIGALSAPSTLENDVGTAHCPKLDTTNLQLAQGVVDVAGPVLVIFLALLVFLGYRKQRAARLELDRKKGCCSHCSMPSSAYSDDVLGKEKLHSEVDW